MFLEMPYEYENLEAGKFRLGHLELLNGNVSVEISIHDLEGPRPCYEALSWQWGRDDPAAGSIIQIRNRTMDGNAQTFEPMLVRPNLLWALKRIHQCHPGFQPLWLWVDFICIKQSDLSERAQQVQYMTQIYEKAKKVHVWLGKPGYLVDGAAQDDFTDQELETAVQHIKLLGNLDDVNHLGNVDTGIRNKASLYNFEPLFKLLKRGWFNRRWIIQEVGVARNEVIVHCGNENFKWEQLTHAVALLEKIGRDGSIDRLFKLQPQTGHVSEYIGNISALPAYRLIQNVSGLYRELGNKTRSETRTIEQLVCYLVIFECTEPRDIIYALLGIASDVQPVHSSGNQLSNDKRKGFQVDYEEDILKVYNRFLSHAIERSGSLDILCRPWAPAMINANMTSGAIKLPSWILDATRKPFRATASGKMIRYNPDPFVGAAVSRGFYAASGGCKQNNKTHLFKLGTASNPKIIRVKGFKLGTPSEIWDLATHGNIPASWLKGANWHDARKPPPDEFWRTLVADRTSAGIEPEPGYPWIIQRAVLEKGVQYGISTREYLYEAGNKAYHEVFRRVEAVVWNRKLIRATLASNNEMKPLGLVPAETRESDGIYIVHGCSVPLVLRERGKREYGKWECVKCRIPAWPRDLAIYEMIGECYIHNMMDGRAIEGSHCWENIGIE